MEPARITLTEFVLVLFNKGIINEQDFVPDKKGYYFKKNALKDFIYVFHENFIKNKRFIDEVSAVLLRLEEKL